MKKRNKNSKSFLLLASLALIVTAVIGTTMAYLVSDTPTVTNTFTPAKVDSEIEETLGVNEKSNVRIQNSITAEKGIDAYIRAKVVVTWQDTYGNVYGKKPETTLGCGHDNCDCDYTITYNLGDQQKNDDSGSTAGKWTLEDDGFYYWSSEVPATKFTGILIESCSPVANKAPEGYNLHVEILAEAIQADGMGATSAENAWAIAKGNQTN